MVKHLQPTELQLIQRISLLTQTSGRAVIRSIGDDCAIFRPHTSPEDLLFTTDLLLEDVHFRRTTHSPEDVGWKALARGLSDIAAMGGEPRFCLLSLAVPRWADTRWIDGFYRGLLRLARREHAPLIGGDLARQNSFACDIVVCGAVPRGTALRRDRARAGHSIFVSGRLGGSALGLATTKGPAWKRHLRPEPRLALGQFLRTHHASACMDLSDGLSIDLHRLCETSGLTAEVTAPPAFRGATLEQALHGGEDYELLFTMPGRATLPASFRGIRLTRIGTMRKGPPGRVICDGRPLAALGYDHFRQ